MPHNNKGKPCGKFWVGAAGRIKRRSKRLGCLPASSWRWGVTDQRVCLHYACLNAAAAAAAAAAKSIVIVVSVGWVGRRQFNGHTSRHFVGFNSFNIAGGASNRKASLVTDKRATFGCDLPSNPARWRAANLWMPRKLHRRRIAKTNRPKCRWMYYYLYWL